MCVGCSFNKNAYFLTKRAFSSSLNKCGSPCPASEQCRSASHTGYSRASNDQAAKAATSVHKRVESYSGNLALATQRDRAGIYSSIQAQTTPFQNAQALRQEIGCLLEKGAVERVPPNELESGFYSRYFVVPKRDGGLRPILDLRPINRALCERPFRMITLKQILGQIPPRGLVCVRGFEGRVLSQSDSTASQTVSEVCFREHSVPILCSPVRAGFGPAHIFKVRGCSTFPPQGERDAHPQLSGRLADFSSVPGHATQPYRLAAYSLGVPRAMCKQAKEHSRPESVHYVSGSLHGLPGNESPPLARTRGGHFVLPAPFQRRQLCSFEKKFRDCWDSWRQLRQYVIWAYYTCDHCSCG